MKKLITCCLGLVAATLSSQADTIADWTFETSQPASAGPFSPEVGSGSASGSHTGSSTYTSPTGNGSSHSFSSTAWSVNDYYQFTVSTLNFQNLSVSYDQTSSNTGPGQGQLEYSTDNGASFKPVQGVYTILANASPNVAWSATTYNLAYTHSFDLSTLTDVNNAASVIFRVLDPGTVAANGGTVASGGTDRIDNFMVTGTSVVVPEPTALSLLGGFGLLAAGFARRKH